MTFVLAAWDAERPPKMDEAKRRYEQLRSGKDPAGPPSAAVTAFAEECGRRWPEDPTDPDQPFTSRRTPSGFLAEIRADEASAVYAELGDMAERHGLVLFDPQSGIVRIPPRLSFDSDPPPLRPGSFGETIRSVRRRRRGDS